MKERFYLACLRDNVGGCIAWHCKDGRGYSTDINKAHEYTKEDAQRAWDNGRSFELPISADHVDALAVHRVDMQYIPNETILDETVNEWVAFKSRCFTGNDVHFITRFDATVDVDQATVFTLSEVKEKATDKAYVFIPKTLADQKKRSTFSLNKLNKRVMVQGAGMLKPLQIKKIERREKYQRTGKSRLNCPKCGKLVWQFNPYEVDECKHCGYDRTRDEFYL